MDANLDSGRTIMSGASGRWAGERLLAALEAGRGISPAELRTLDTLRKDEWKAFDEALVEEGQIRLRVVADLIAQGLTIPIANAMGKTFLEWEKVTDMQDAVVSLSGVDRSEDDRVDFSLDSIPLPITHKDFNLNLRTLIASRTRGEALDTTQARVAGRKVGEMIEYITLNGSKTFGGKTLYGLLNHPNINTASFGDATWTDSGVTGEEILTDVFTLIAALETDRFFGPYNIVVPSTYSTKLELDFKAASDKTIRQRIMEVDRVKSVTVADQMTADKVLMYQGTKDVVAMVNGEALQTIQWDIEGGFVIKFKAFAIQVPLVRADASGRSGVVLMSA